MKTIIDKIKTYQYGKIVENIVKFPYKKKFNKFIKNFKNVSKNYFKTNVLFSVFIVSSLINATLLRVLTVANYFDVYPVLADAAVLLIIGSFGYYIKPKHQFKYFFVLSIITTALAVINSMYYTNYLSFSSVSLLATSFQIVDVGDAVIENVMEIKDFAYIWQIFALLYVNHVLKKRGYYDLVNKIEKGKKRAFNTLVAGVILIGVFISSLNAIDISRLNKQWNREFVVMRFGIFTYQLNDIYSSVRTRISPFFGYDKNAKLFRDYYIENPYVSSKNKYTNIFEGKNVIVIHAESIQNFVLDVSFNGVPVAPNLKQMAKEGIYFSNFYAQESVGTSSDSEFTLVSSLMPAASGTVFINYFDRDYITTQKMLKDKGYYTFSMHGNNGTFWNRTVTHQSLGYDRFFSYPEDYVLDEKIGLGLSDQSFFAQSLPKIKEISEKNKNFYGSLLMLTNHTPFSDINHVSEYEVTYKYQLYNELTKKNETIVAPFMEGTKLGDYFKSVNYADKAIGDFIDNLDKEGLLDNTVIVIYGDHDAKLKKSEYNRFYNYDPYTDTVLDKNDPNYDEITYYEYELNRNVPFIIWTKNKQFKKEVTTVMGMYDVSPTLGNMFGFENKYALGHDVFSYKDNVVVFPDGDWVTDKMYYNSQKEEGITLKIGDTVSVEYIEKYNKHAQDVISVSDAIIVYDLLKEEKNKLPTN